MRRSWWCGRAEAQPSRAGGEKAISDWRCRRRRFPSFDDANRKWPKPARVRRLARAARADARARRRGRRRGAVAAAVVATAVVAAAAGVAAAVVAAAVV